MDRQRLEPASPPPFLVERPGVRGRTKRRGKPTARCCSARTSSSTSI